MKKRFFGLILAFILALGFVLTAVGCEKKPTYDLLKDTDYDGLCDAIDPDPNDNKYEYKLYSEGGSPLNTKTDNFSVDYRNFLYESTPEFNVNIAKMAILFIHELYGKAKTINILKNEYTNEQSNISKILVQFGCQNVSMTVMNPLDYQNDLNDLVGITFGNRMFLDENKNKHQIFFAGIIGYPKQLNNAGWKSNFDIGSDTADYTAYTGEQHPEWVNKKHHKGFDVTANRVYDLLTTYIEQNSVANAEKTVFITGHSRGGAVSNLVGKKLKDNGIKSLAYCFNAPTTTTETDESLKSSYTNIFNIENKDDIVALIPTPKWGFSLYGKTLNYKISDDNVIEKWNDFFNMEYEYNSQEYLDTVQDFLHDELANDREGIYSLKDEYVKEFISEKQAEKERTSIEDQFKTASDLARNSFTLSVDGKKLIITTRPAIIIALLNDAFNGNPIMPYFSVMKKYINAIISNIVNLMPESIVGFKYAHEITTNIVGVENIIPN